MVGAYRARLKAVPSACLAELRHAATQGLRRRPRHQDADPVGGGQRLGERLRDGRMERRRTGAFQHVIDGFKELYPDSTSSTLRRATNCRRCSRRRSRAVTRRHRCGPPARPHEALRQAESAEADRLTPRARSRELPPGWLTLGTSTARCTASSSRAPTSRPSGTTSSRSRTPACSRRRPGTTCSRGPRPSRRRASRRTRSEVPTAGPHRPLREHLPAHRRSGHVRQADQRTTSRGPTRR